MPSSKRRTDGRETSVSVVDGMLMAGMIVDKRFVVILASNGAIRTAATTTVASIAAVVAADDDNDGDGDGDDDDDDDESEK